MPDQELNDDEAPETPRVEDLEDLDELFEEPMYAIVSRVRSIQTRTQRAISPTRHRFTQYILGGTQRLIRRRSVQVPESRLLEHLDELKEKTRLGILEVQTLDGRTVNLDTFEATPPHVPAPEPHPPLDSAANDEPAGIPLPTMPGGSWQGDPAAARAAMEAAQSKASQASNEDALVTELMLRTKRELEAEAEKVGLEVRGNKIEVAQALAAFISSKQEKVENVPAAKPEGMVKEGGEQGEQGEQEKNDG